MNGTKNGFWTAIAGLLALPALHPLLIPVLGLPSHLLWWVHVLPRGTGGVPSRPLRGGRHRAAFHRVPSRRRAALRQNALDAVPSGTGVIELSVHRVDEDVLVNVADNGPGVEPALHVREPARAEAAVPA